ncbi:MAG: molybdopterin-binding protein [Acetobacteraceae bacterium]|nr:molybdopterin-binding protein [Acetobacteraceae bacterium]
MTVRDPRPTAAVIVIGDEVLSGRTHDSNLPYLARRLGELGIRLTEARVVPDAKEAIVRAVNELRARNAYVFTTGGIGPTHDDITAESIAAAFGVPCERNEEAWRILADDYAKRGVEFNEARQRMAMVPRGAELVRCEAVAAPGFRIGNVFVFAGVPRIMQSMFEAVAPTLAGGAPTVSRTVHAIGALEGQIAKRLGGIQADHPEVAIGSYPFYREPGGGVAIVARGTDQTAVDRAIDAVAAMFRDFGFEPREGEPPPG